MADARRKCTCTRLPDGAGGSWPAAWLGMHERVAVRGAAEQRIEGRPSTVWRQAAGGFGLEVRTDDGSVIHVPTSKAQSVMPVVAPDPLNVVESVARWLRRPFEIPNDGRMWMSVIADEHHYVSVSASLLRMPCFPLRD